MKDSIVLIEIDLKNIDKTRKEWPFFKDRRPDNYKEILDGSGHGTERIE
jgi:predicted amidohydrolase